MSGLVFTKEKVNQTRLPLVRLLRIIFYKLKVTNDDLIRMHMRYWSRTRPGDHTAVTHRNNLRRRIDDDMSLTWKAFHFVLNDIMRLSVVRISVTVIDPDTNEEVIYNSDEVVDGN